MFFLKACYLKIKSTLSFSQLAINFIGFSFILRSPTACGCSYDLSVDSIPRDFKSDVHFSLGKVYCDTLGTIFTEIWRPKRRLLRQANLNILLQTIDYRQVL